MGAQLMLPLANWFATAAMMPIAVISILSRAFQSIGDRLRRQEF